HYVPALLVVCRPIKPPPRFTLFPYTTLFRSILMLAYAVEDGPVELVLDEGDMRRLVEAWIAEGHTLVAHNASFERIALSRLLGLDRKSTRLNSSHVKISYAVSRLKQKQR